MQVLVDERRAGKEVERGVEGRGGVVGRREGEGGLASGHEIIFLRSSFGEQSPKEGFGYQFSAKFTEIQKNNRET